MNTIDQRRIFPLNPHPVQDGPIIYWMSRDQRVHDNWALLYAAKLAEGRGQPLTVVFCLVPTFLEATERQYGFMIKGLEEVESELQKLAIPFHLLLGNPPEEVARFAKKIKAGAVVTEFDPLRIKKEWHEKTAKLLPCAMYEVDAHNIVPCRVASIKQEFGAYTLRPKLQRVLSEYLTPFPTLKKQTDAAFHHSPIDWKAAFASLSIDRTVKEVTWCVPGEKAARQALKRFINERSSQYDQDRNDPTKDGQSNLSPYLHFGQLSAQRVVLEIEKSAIAEANKKAFLEELIVRKELSDNFCFYNPNYDSPHGFPEWAKKTLLDHVDDAREYLYTPDEFEHARTHDPLWNAAQLQMVTTGKMHGYMRMYWAKKILEWTKNPAEAQKIAIYLNDKYELDGRDPNGYVGIAWSIGGVHDRAWFDRPIFGKIRYMSYNGCKSKFDVKAYIETFSSLGKI